MKNIFSTALLLLISLGTLRAAEPRVLIVTNDNVFSGYMTAADKSHFLWRESVRSTSTRKQSRSTSTVYFFQPADLSEALELYKSRNYKDAAVKFAAVAKAYNKVDEIPGNPSTLAGFYQLESLRKMGDVDGLMRLAEKYDPECLTREFDRLQYQLYGIFWDAVRTKSWSRLDQICSGEKWSSRKLPGNLRAQLSYCHGLALEGLGKPLLALNAYNVAFVADFSASEEMTRNSASNCLRILLNNEDVKSAMKLYPTEDYSDRSAGALLIKEATALIELWGKVLGAGEALPPEYQVFLEFPPKGE